MSKEVTFLNGSTGNVENYLEFLFSVFFVKQKDDFNPMFAIPEARTFLKDTDTGNYFVYNNSSNIYNQISTNPESHILSITANSISIFKNTVSSYIDYLSSSYGYGDIAEAISFSSSGITSWREEGIAFKEYRDNSLSLMYDNINSYLDNSTSLPIEIDTFISQGNYIPLSLGGLSGSSKENTISYISSYIYNFDKNVEGYTASFYEIPSESV